MLEEIGIEGGKIPDDTRLELDLLQAIRLALIMRIFILAAQLPRFYAAQRPVARVSSSTWR